MKLRALSIQEEAQIVNLRLQPYMTMAHISRVTGHSYQRVRAAWARHLHQQAIAKRMVRAIPLGSFPFLNHRTLAVMDSLFAHHLEIP